MANSIFKILKNRSSLQERIEEIKREQKERDVKYYDKVVHKLLSRKVANERINVMNDILLMLERLENAQNEGCEMIHIETLLTGWEKPKQYALFRWQEEKEK